MINQFKKINPTCLRKRESEAANLISSNIMVTSEFPVSPPSLSGFNKLGLLSKSSDEKFAIKKLMDQSQPAILDISLWNRAKTRKVIGLTCNSRKKLFNEISNLGFSRKKKQNNGNLKEVANIKIQIFEDENGEKSFRFNVNTMESTRVKKNARQELEWIGGKDTLDFKINLNQNLTKSDWGIPSPPKIPQKENVLKTLFKPTREIIQTPSPKSNKFIFDFFLLKLTES